MRKRRRRCDGSSLCEGSVQQRRELATELVSSTTNEVVAEVIAREGMRYSELFFVESEEVSSRDDGRRREFQGSRNQC